MSDSWKPTRFCSVCASGWYYLTQNPLLSVNHSGHPGGFSVINQTSITDSPSGFPDNAVVGVLGTGSDVARAQRSLHSNQVDSSQDAKVVAVSVAVLAVIVVVVEARRVTGRCLLLETPSGLLRHKYHHAGRQ